PRRGRHRPAHPGHGAERDPAVGGLSMRRLVSASLHGHARRFVAGGIAVVLSVAYVCAVLITVDSAKAAVQAAIAAQYSRADLVVSRSDGQVGPAMLERIKAVDGVAGAAAAA